MVKNSLSKIISIGLVKHISMNILWVDGGVAIQQLKMLLDVEPKSTSLRMMKKMTMLETQLSKRMLKLLDVCVVKNLVMRYMIALVILISRLLRLRKLTKKSKEFKILLNKGNYLPIPR